MFGKNRPTFLILAILAMVLLMTVPIAYGDGGDQNLPAPPVKTDLEHLNLGSHLNQLVAAVEQGALSAREAATSSAISSGESVAVTIFLTGNVDDVVDFLEDNGGDPRNVGDHYIEAYVPVTLLDQLSEQPGVIRVREIIPPQPMYGDVTSQGVQTHFVQAWHDAGYSGQGVKVGIIDTGFEGFTNLIGNELPTPVAVRCYTDIGEVSNSLADCENDSVHGTAVAEALIDIAPDASLYLSNVFTPGDLQDTVDWMISQGVEVINTSLGFAWDGPGDGSSPFDGSVDYVHPDWEGIDESLHYSPLRAVDRAVEAGIVWVTSAGNQAQKTWFESGSSLVLDSDGFVEFAPSEIINCFLVTPDTRFNAELRWDDTWGGATRDLDMGLWDIQIRDFVRFSRDFQSGGIGHFPYEYISGRYSGSTETVACWVVWDTGGSQPDWIQLQHWADNGEILQHYTREGSIENPAESANPGLLAVGATHHWDTLIIADYSSQGPTPDGRVKPDIVGVACGETASYEHYLRGGEDCWFSGTSQASPHVAGMAALVRQKYPEFTPQQVAQVLKDYADERGDPGADNTWGSGFAEMPPPDTVIEPPPITDQCGETLTGDGTVSGTWAAGCDSEVSGRGHARYYSFTLEQSSEVTITLESTDADTYLYLRSGDATSGTFLHQNDDDGGTTKSTIQETLAAGSYTIEATTYGTGETGAFTLTVSGLGGTTPDPGTGTGCGQTITADGTVSGTWAAGCDSEVSGRGHARYYSFTLEQSSEVTITLESTDADTYLYLRSGDATSGTFLHQNDDDGGTTKSTIQETLAAGSYTIEATTYGTGETGDFTLTVSGLGGTTPDPGTGTGCGQTITADGTVSGTWAAGCDSEVSGRGHARYYSFTLSQESEVTITLESTDADTYLYLRAGDARSGAFLYENDDDGGTTKSTIQETLAAGSYTIEATTYGTGETGSFTLTVSGLGGTTPDPGTGTGCGQTITADGTVSGTWAAGCDSEVSGRGHARYYSFTLAQESEVTITLESSDADTYLYLREGDARSGAFLYENDDDGGTTKSTIEETLAAGSYTIEATTYGTGETGDFTLTVSGLGDTAPTPGPDPTDQCGETLTGDGTVSGNWDAGCDSEASGRGHARYYGFTLAQESEVTITLESSDADTYLYLREGDARSGAFLYENDDDGGTTKSTIEETLAAGSYTIEATTYGTGETGDFTLTVSGLGGTTPDPGTGTGCGETITADGTVSGTWAAGCDSEASGRGHARYYGFTLAQESEVTITLESSDADTYLYLREGDARSGAFLYENDDDGGTTKSTIEETLAAGSYTIEATTYGTGETGDFTLTVSGLGDTAPTPGPDPTDQCGETLTGDGTVSGNWDAGCDSEASGRGHARYYGFTLAQESEVTITLESSDADTYLYLREGDARSGAFLYENDDDGGTTKSTIEETLAAGSYTIEATTYGTGETGDFTLTVSGLGGTTPDPGTGTGCGETITADGTVSGTWAAGCDSEVSGRGHARYFGFTLSQESEVTITLESTDADTYLYLRDGDARSGAFLYENDDDGGTTKSTIQETLAAGTYTIEATTYGTGETGDFTLTVSGLGGNAA